MEHNISKAIAKENRPQHYPTYTTRTCLSAGSVKRKAQRQGGINGKHVNGTCVWPFKPSTHQRSRSRLYSLRLVHFCPEGIPLFSIPGHHSNTSHTVTPHRPPLLLNIFIQAFVEWALRHKKFNHNENEPSQYATLRSTFRM